MILANDLQLEQISHSQNADSSKLGIRVKVARDVLQVAMDVMEEVCPHH